MITRGTFLSQSLAGLIAAAPVLVPLAAFFAWAAYDLNAQARRIAAEELRAREVAAVSHQTAVYSALGEVWREFAGSAASGLWQTEDARAAERALIERLEAAVVDAKGVWMGAKALPRDDARGIQRVRAEISANVPEAALPGLLAELETDRPLIFVDLLDARRVDEADGRVLLNLRLRVSGFRLREEAS